MVVLCAAGCDLAVAVAAVTATTCPLCADSLWHASNHKEGAYRLSLQHGQASREDENPPGQVVHLGTEFQRESQAT